MITDHFYEGSTPQVGRTVLCLVFVKQELFSCSFVKAHRQPLARCSLLGEANYHCCLLCRLLHFLLLLLLIFFSKLSLLGKVLRWAVYRQDTLLINQCILCAADWMYRASIKLLRIFYQMLMGNKLSWMDSVQAKTNYVHAFPGLKLLWEHPLGGASDSTLGVELSSADSRIPTLQLHHSTLRLVKVSFNLVRQLRLRPSLFPGRVSSKHFCHPLICGKGTQFEALDKEEILKLDLEIHSILIR